MIEDIVMTDLTKEETKEKENVNPIYFEYRKTLSNIDKAVSLKDTKTLYLYFRLLNKFRRSFTDEDCSFICDNILRDKFHFSFIPKLEPQTNV